MRISTDTQRRAGRRPPSRRTVAVFLGIPVVLLVSVVTAPPAWAECRVINQYTIDPGAGYWDQYEVLLVPPSSGAVEQTITTSRSLSSTSSMSAELGTNIKGVIAEVNTKLHASYAETVTIESGRSTKMTAPPNDKNQEIRFGTFIDIITVKPEYWGQCGNHTPNNTYPMRAAKPAAGIVVVG